MNQFLCGVARKSASESQHCLVRRGSRTTAVPELHVDAALESSKVYAV
jgi:hypothetical protein